MKFYKSSLLGSCVNSFLGQTMNLARLQDYVGIAATSSTAAMVPAIDIPIKSAFLKISGS